MTDKVENIKAAGILMAGQRIIKLVKQLDASIYEKSLALAEALEKNARGG